MRLLPGQRCRTPVSVWLPHDSTGSEESLEETTKSAPRPRANFNQSTLDFSKDVVIRETDRLQIAPSVDEMADMLRTTIMVSPTPPILGPQYTSYVLHLIEGYNKLRNNLSKKETEVAQLQTVRQEDEERSQSLVSDWSAQEARYKAEIKRLEKIIYQISGNGVEAVALARSGSLVRRGAKYRGLAIAATTTDTISEKVAEEDFCHDGYGDSDPCSQGADSQGRRTCKWSSAINIYLFPLPTYNKRRRKRKLMPSLNMI